MEKLTLYVNKSEYKIEIDDKFTNLNSLEDIEDMENTIPGFFDVESIGRQDNKVFLAYHIPEGYEPFVNVKRYERIIKVQMVQQLLEMDPLLECDKTSLDLNNIFFQAFREIKLLYRSTGCLPYDDTLDRLEQYKLFALGFISSKYAYKKYVVQKDILLKKENDEFFFQINAAQTFGDLKSTIDAELKRMQTDYYKKLQFSVDSKKKGKKRRLFISALLIILLSLLFVGGLKQTEKNVALEFEEEIKAAELENDIIQATSSGDTERAIKLMEKNNEDPLEIAEMLVFAGKYDEAIAYSDNDSKIEAKVVDRLYELEQQEKILTLKSESSFLETERLIIEYNTDILDAQIGLIENKSTLKRLGLAYINHGNLNMAIEVQNKLNDGELDNYIKKAELETQINTINDEIYSLEEANKEENAEDINTKKETVIDLQKELIQLEEKMETDS